MSSYSPPTQITSVFNSWYFSQSDEYLTIGYADSNYLSSKHAAFANGLFTCNNGLAVSGSITLNGTVLDLTGLGYVSGVTPGTVSASKAVVVDSNKDISAFRNLTATNLTGTLQTAAQPNITSIGTLATLTATSITGTLQTAAQPNITSIGTLTGLTSSGTISGLIMTATTMTCNGVDVGSNIAPLVGITLGTPAASKVLTLNASSQIAGNLTLIGNLTATNLTGTLQTAAQPNITSLGTLTSLTATSITGTLQTAAQPNITSVGTLTTLNVSGVSSTSNTRITTTSNYNGIMDTASIVLKQSSTTNGNKVGIDFVVTTNTIDSVNTATCAIFHERIAVYQGDLIFATKRTAIADSALIEALRISSTGTCTIANSSSGYQLDLGSTGNGLRVPSITIGTTAITTSGSELNALAGVTPGTVSASKAMVVDSSKNISGLNQLKIDSDLYMSQTAVLRICRDVSTGDLNSTIYSDGIASLCLSSIRGGGQVKILTNANTTNNCFTINNATSGTNHLTMRADNKTGLYTNTPGYGLDIQSSLNCTSLYINGTQVTSTASELNYVDITTQGLAQASKAMVLDSAKNITSINSIYASLLSASNIISSNSYATSGVSTRVASLYGHQAFGSINTNGSYVSAGISFLNASADQMPQASIVLDRKALDQGDLCIYTQSPTFNLSETARFLSTGALSINYGSSPAAMISCKGSDSYLYGTQYQRLLRLESNHATPVKFEVSLNKNTASTTTNECLLGTTTANDLYIGTDSTYRMCIKATTNYIGLGDNGSSIDKVFGVLHGTTGSGIVDMRFGNALSTNNCFTMTYAPTSSGSGLNRLQFDPYGTSGALTILAKKYVGIGTTGPVCPLDVAGYDSGLGILAPYQFAGATSGDGGYVASGTTTGININAIFRSNVIFDDKIYIRSDRRVKKDIVPLTVDLGIKFVEEVDPVLFRKRDQPSDAIQEIGYIAQDIMRSGFGNIITHTDNDTMQYEQEGDIENIQFNVDYSRVCAILHIVIRDQKKCIESLTRRLERLEQLIEGSSDLSPGKKKFALKRSNI